MTHPRIVPHAMLPGRDTRHAGLRQGVPVDGALSSGQVLSEPPDCDRLNRSSGRHGADLSHPMKRNGTASPRRLLLDLQGLKFIAGALNAGLRRTPSGSRSLARGSATRVVAPFERLLKGSPGPRSAKGSRPSKVMPSRGSTIARLATPAQCISSQAIHCSVVRRSTSGSGASTTCSGASCRTALSRPKPSLTCSWTRMPAPPGVVP